MEVALRMCGSFVCRWTSGPHPRSPCERLGETHLGRVDDEDANVNRDKVVSLGAQARLKQADLNLPTGKSTCGHFVNK